MTSAKSISVVAAAAVAALGLSACDGANGHAAASGICKPFTTTTTTTTSTTTTQTSPAGPATGVGVLPAAPMGDPSAAIDDCLHRWGYTLAGSSDAANFVAEATVAACGTALSSWNQQALNADNAGGAVQAPSLMTGQSTNPISEHYSFAQGRALFYVVQARAGHCGPPPAGATSDR
ncbi:hypothetical protein [Phenylobacterium sp.]|uniref:hypothetical protein n=1 Tax=Phenylobacterium sp. TaxID=1871053 RepID=UPI002DED6C81|nr:hypothetical protein [Phenylobacterium sp.]